MMHALCSIVVPVFNEATNIEKCFEILHKQTYKNIEVVFINDGSTDDSKTILTQMAEKHSDIKVKIIEQENQGAAAARKKGIIQSSGDYIAFLDCDDELSENAIFEAMTSFRVEIDIVLFHLKYQSQVNEGLREVNDFLYFTNQKTFLGYDALINSLESWGVHGLGIYRKNILLKSYIAYEKENTQNYINNDEVITRLSFMNSNLIQRSSGIYFYNNNLNSTTKRVNESLYKKIYNSIILYKIISTESNGNVNPNLIVSYAWESSKYFFLNREFLNNASDWSGAVSDANKFIWKNNLFKLLSIKRKFQFLILVIWQSFIL
ncbi:glycosyltransferase family 2 protein [Acinetobacter pullicarnis]|uniref:glycosyltransferase family 2 protein n=1 Tax=Acinetobacter pullicarnis TaxID=2576829 RepID=UPI00112197AC|nr:glycosyltransferase family 2 protein [Acinetobacter pullicarnis]